MKFGNDEFGDDARVAGWLENPDGTRSLVTTQPLIKGRDALTGEINTYMRRKGYQRAMEGVWQRERDGKWVTDVLPKNVLTDAAGRVHVIDFLAPHLSPDSEARYESHTPSLPGSDARAGRVRRAGSGSKFLAAAATVVTVLVNGVKVQEADLARIQLQTDHRPPPDRSRHKGHLAIVGDTGTAEFRDMRIKELLDKP